jgi:diacylglycerol kinase (ATP)
MGLNSNSFGKKADGFSLKERAKSFRAALNGIVLLVKHEHNARIHLFILTLVIIAGLLLKIRAMEWLAIAIVSGLVLAGECFNSAVEYLSDRISHEFDEEIRKAKDIAAAGVLISAIVAVVAGLVIFIPAILRLGWFDQ